MTGGENGQGGLLRGIADWACEPRLAFAPEALHQARLCFVDTLACMAAGSGEPLVRRTGDALRRGGSAGAVATVLGGAGLAAPAAALVNGAAAHALDFDDYEIPASTHPSAVIVPALLAVSDLRTVSLGDLLSAYLVSYETVVTLGRALGGYAHYAAGWHATSTV